MVLSGECHNITHFQISGSVRLVRLVCLACVLRKDIPSDIPAVDLEVPAAHNAAAHIALQDGNGAACHLLRHADMIGPAGVVPDAVIIPIIEDDVRRFRYIGVVFFPDSHLLCQLYHLAASALQGDDVIEPCLDCCCRYSGGAVCVRVLHGIVPRQRLMSVVGINNYLVGAVRPFQAYPALHDAQYVLPRLRLCHSCLTSFWFGACACRIDRCRLCKLVIILLSISSPFLLYSLSLVLRTLKINEDGIRRRPHRSCRFQNLQDISVAGGKFLHEEIQLHLQITD